MAAYDENSYSTDSFSIRAFWFSDIVSNAWVTVLTFRLRIATKLNITLKR